MSMLGNKSLSVYSKDFSPNSDNATKFGHVEHKSSIPPTGSKQLQEQTMDAPPTIQPIRGDEGQSRKALPDDDMSSASPSPTNIKHADPRDFRKFTLLDAKARQLKLGVVNKISSPQRKVDVTLQIIEAARLKNSQHFVHAALQGDNTAMVHKTKTERNKPGPTDTLRRRHTTENASKSGPCR